MSSIQLIINTGVIVPVNFLQLTDDSDFKTIETSVAYNASGMALKWNFVTTSGVQSQTAVTPTNSGTHAWGNLGNGMYSIAIPSSGGTINNNTAGYGWFSGVATGILPWISPIITFAPANVVNSIVAGTDNLQVDSTEFAGQTITAAAGVTLPSSVASPTNITAGTITTATNVTTVNGLANNVITASSIASDAITAGKIAADAIGASELAADAIAEIQSGLATSSSIAALNNIAATDIVTNGPITTSSGDIVNVQNTDEIGNQHVNMTGGNVWSLNENGDPISTGLSTFDESTDIVLANIKEIDDSSVAAAILGAIYKAFENGTAQNGGSSTITLRSGASNENDYYKDQAIFTIFGTGAGQTNRIIAYDQSTKIATVKTPWIVQPDSTTVYVLLGRIG